MFSDQRHELRSQFILTWHKVQQGMPLSTLEQQVAQAIYDHPEYHHAMHTDYLDRDYPPEHGQTNPFLHLSLHLTVRDQIQTDHPLGISAIYQQLLLHYQDPHEVEHHMIEALMEVLWSAQQSQILPSEQAYLDLLRAQHAAILEGSP